MEWQSINEMAPLVSAVLNSKYKDKKIMCELAHLHIPLIVNKHNKEIHNRFNLIIEDLEGEDLINSNNESILHTINNLRNVSFGLITEILSNPKFTEIINHQNNNGVTALMLAFSTNHLKNAKLLIKLGADINILDNKNQNILFHIEQKESNHPASISLIKELLDKNNINLNIVNYNNEHIGFHLIHPEYLNVFLNNSNIDKKTFLNLKNNKEQTVISKLVDNIHAQSLSVISEKHQGFYNTTKYLDMVTNFMKIINTHFDIIDFDNMVDSNLSLIAHINKIYNPSLKLKVNKECIDKIDTIKNFIEQVEIKSSIKDIELKKKKDFKI